MTFQIGDQVQRAPGSDYRMPATVVAVFTKLSGQIRYVVEDDRGTLFVQSDKTIVARDEVEG